MTPKEIIAGRAAKEIRDGMVVNLGIGLPTLISNFVPGEVKITLQSENGILGMGPLQDDPITEGNIVNAGGQPVQVNDDACFFDSAVSFAIIRGGHVDLSILGALQVDEAGNIASHIIPDKMVPGMGGAMDLVTGSREVIVTMRHSAKNLAPKILKQITLPATGIQCVDMIITELAVIEVTKEGLLLREISKETTLEEVISRTEARLIVSDEVGWF